MTQAAKKSKPKPKNVKYNTSFSSDAEIEALIDKHRKSVSWIENRSAAIRDLIRLGTYYAKEAAR